MDAAKNATNLTIDVVKNATNLTMFSEKKSPAHKQNAMSGGKPSGSAQGLRHTPFS